MGSAAKGMLVDRGVDHWPQCPPAWVTGDLHELDHEGARWGFSTGRTWEAPVTVWARS